MPDRWDDLRASEFPVTRNWVYLDHAAVAPLPRRSGELIRAWADGQQRDGLVHWPEWGKRVEAARDAAALLLGADRAEIALVNSTTQGIGLVAEGFPWREGDSVVIPAEEYPSNVYPWMNLADRGVSVRLVPGRDGRIWPEDLVAAMDATTRVLAVSHVEFASGFRNDLDAICELCHARGVAVLVDAIQGLGPLVLDVRETPVDFLAADGHKWLLGPEGAGLLYVRRDWIERLRPLGVGWHSVVGSFTAPGLDFRLKPTAERWEGGSFNMPGLIGLGASLSLIHELGPQAVSARILDRAAEVRELAAGAGWRVVGSLLPGDVAGIVALEADGIDPDAAASGLRREGIVVSARRGRLRVSPHIYNNADDLGRLRAALDELRRRRVVG